MEGLYGSKGDSHCGISQPKICLVIDRVGEKTPKKLIRIVLFSPCSLQVKQDALEQAKICIPQTRVAIAANSSSMSSIGPALLRILPAVTRWHYGTTWF